MNESKLKPRNYPVDYCHIIELQHNYYSLYIPKVYKKIFGSKSHGMNAVVALFEFNYITASQLTSLVTMIGELPIPFMMHHKDTLESVRQEIEKNEKILLLYDINEARTFEQVLLTNEPQIGLHRIPDSELEGYILTRKHRSGVFNTFEEGRDEAQKMLSNGQLRKDLYNGVIKKIFKLFGEKIFPIEFHPSFN